MSNEENYEVRNEKIEKLLKSIGKLIQLKLPKGYGFTLMIFDYGNKKDKSLFYLSSAKREDMIEAMAEFIDRQQDITS